MGEDGIPCLSGTAESKLDLLTDTILRMEGIRATQLEGLYREIYKLQDAQRHDSASSEQLLAYRQMVNLSRELVRSFVPMDSTLIVISKGDADLLSQFGRTAWHFPRSSDGSYSGHYPANSTAAIAHLEYLRAIGAQYLFIPETSRWWIDSYAEFGRHVSGRFKLVARQPGVGILYDLRSIMTQSRSTATLEDVASDFRARHGREPAILDWHSGHEIGGRLPTAAVFRAAGSAAERGAERLPYLDRSIDFVALSTDASSAVAAEARRVALYGLLAVGGTVERPTVSLECLPGPEIQSMPSVSIIIPVHNALNHTISCLRALDETLPESINVEVIVVDDASTDSTQTWLQQFPFTARRLRDALTVIRSDVNRGFVETCNTGAATATGEVLLFLNNDTIPLPGWLPPMLRVLRDSPDVGAVGGRMLFPDGRLQEAGGIIFRDGTAAHFGRDEMDCDQPLFSFVREADYCSAACLATPASVFRELGGFDTAFKPGYYEDTDYCFRLRASGRRVMSQPDANIVHVEGGTAGRDLAVGMKRYQLVNREKFITRWANTLRKHSVRPKHLEFSDWHRLAATGGGKDGAQ